MAQAKRFIVASQTAPGLSPQALQTFSMFTRQFAPNEVKQTLTGRRVVEMTSDQAARLARSDPDLIVEEDTPLRLFQGIPGLPPSAPRDRPFSFPVRVLEVGTEKPISNVTIFGLGEKTTYKAENRTNEAGETALDSAEARLRLILASPQDSYWSMLFANVHSADLSSANPLTINLAGLPVRRGYGWGHALMGFPAVHQFCTGRGIRIGVIDSGISSQVQDLHPAGGMNTLDGEDPAAWNNDLEGHGTHCAGIASATPGSATVIGGAPNASVFAVRVFPGGFTSDLVQAVEWCIQNNMDVISMSLGMSESKLVLHNTLAQAHSRGITCVAATGNDATAVAYPAAFPQVIAVGAIGQLGTFPNGSGHVMKVGTTAPLQPGLFAANFTNFGPQVAVCAPGVAVLSTVPTGYAAWDGTSMACPMVSALVALLLEACPHFRVGNAMQPEFMRMILASSAVNLGLPQAIQGAGLPIAMSALASARRF